jgi:hypothetical protein
MTNMRTMTEAEWRRIPIAEKTDADYAAYWKSKCVVTATGCWEWQGQLMKGPPHKNGPTCLGYAESCYRRKHCRVSRIMLGFKLGRPLTKDERACHTCDYTPCINPDHLWLGDDKANMQDAGKKKRWPRQTRDTCAQGHPRTPETMSWVPSTGKLQCRICRRQWTKRYYKANQQQIYQKQRAKVLAERAKRGW